MSLGTKRGFLIFSLFSFNHCYQASELTIRGVVNVMLGMVMVTTRRRRIQTDEMTTN